MAYMNKNEMLERRAISAARRGIDNNEILIESGVDKDVAALIAVELPEIRHNFHVNIDSIFNAESNEHGYGEKLTEGLNAINKLLGTNFSIDDEEYWTSSIDADIDIENLDRDDDDYYEKREDIYFDYLEKWTNEANVINNVIEEAMAAMDDKYGTNICPTGAHRMQY